MPRWLPLLAAAAVALSAAPTVAAPTCWNAQAQTVRCGAPGALPVGTRLSPAQETLRRSRTSEAPLLPLIGLSLLLAGLFGLIALMPDFERWDGR